MSELQEAIISACESLCQEMAQNAFDMPGKNDLEIARGVITFWSFM